MSGQGFFTLSPPIWPHLHCIAFVMISSQQYSVCNKALSLKSRESNSHGMKQRLNISGKCEHFEKCVCRNGGGLKLLMRQCEAWPGFQHMQPLQFYFYTSVCSTPATYSLHFCDQHFISCPIAHTVCCFFPSHGLEFIDSPLWQWEKTVTSRGLCLNKIYKLRSLLGRMKHACCAKKVKLELCRWWEEVQSAP